MDDKKIKCSSNKHKDTNAISYCINCKLYLCNKCQKMHSEFYEEHNLINLDKDLNNFFIDECNKENHDKIKLKFFCKKHNILCCAYCVSKINKFGFGEHYNCDFAHINEIKEEKRNKLKENIKTLQELSKNIDNIINELKNINENINKDKDELKINIQKLFTKLKSAINEKEDQLLTKVDEIYDNSFITDELVKSSEKLPNKIKASLEKGNLIQKEWNENDLANYINICLYIENNIKEINKIKDVIEKYKSKSKTKVKFDINKDTYNTLLESIDNFANIISEEEYIYKYYDIKLKNPILTLNYHTSNVWCLTVLKDGRLVSGSEDKSIIIYNKITYQPDLVIKEHNDSVYCILQLSSGTLASCSKDKTIKLFNIKENEYEIIQTLEYHTKAVYKLIELKSNNLISCSDDNSLIIYSKQNNKYIKDFQIETNNRCSSVIQTKDTEICYSVFSDNEIDFFDLSERKNKATLTEITKCNNHREWIIMISKDLLLIPGEKELSIININEYKLVRKIKASDSSWLCGICKINNNMILTGDDSKIKQWKIENDNLILVSKKDNAHNGWINALLNLGNGYIVSCSDDNTIKIW